jgi:maltooligosyltrehalose synthase
VVAYARQLEHRWAVVVVPRFVRKLSPSTRPPVGKRLWKDTRLQLPERGPSEWQNVFTGATLVTSERDNAAGGLLVHEVCPLLPVALLGGSSS